MRLGTLGRIGMAGAAVVVYLLGVWVIEGRPGFIETVQAAWPAALGVVLGILIGGTLRRTE